MIFTLVILIWIGGYVYFITATNYAVPEQKDEKTDAIVVLTGGNYRTHTGLTLFAEGLAPNLMITGVNKAVTEQDIRNLWKNDTALPACCIILGHMATTTLENAQEVKGWIKDKNFKSIRLVTSTYHMQRAMMEFNAAMPDLKIIVHPVEEEDYSLNEWQFWVITFSEYNKFILRGLALVFTV